MATAMIRFNKKYFFFSLLLLLIEIYIGFFVHDNFVRPYIGDLLVVILIYCFIRSFFEIVVWKLALGVLVFSYIIETLQYVRIVELLGLSNSRFASTMIGTSFAWWDIVAYTIGIGIVLLFEYRTKSAVTPKR